jgi:uncharacterized protein YcfJ
MKQTVLFAAMGLAAFGASAQEFGNVVSSVPVIQQVSVPRTVCQPVAPGQVSTTGGGAVVGGLTGAGVGSMIGAGSGNAAAIAAGTIIGAIVGNNVEAQNQRYAQTAPQCYTQNTLENRTVAYDVTYEYRGQQYSARMPYDPGRSVQLQAPAVAQAAPGGSAGGVVVAPPVQQAQAEQQPMQQQPQVQQAQVAPQQPQYVQGQPQYVQGQPQVIVQQQPTPVVVQQYPVYPAYPYYAPYPYYRPYPYVPFGLSLGFGFYGGGHHHH